MRKFIALVISDEDKVLFFDKLFNKFFLLFFCNEWKSLPLEKPIKILLDVILNFEYSTPMPLNNVWVNDLLDAYNKFPVLGKFDLKEVKFISLP